MHTYTPETACKYNIDHIINDLGGFLKFIRKTTQNYKRNENKTNRNNSISIIYLLCRLQLFKETDEMIDTDIETPSSQWAASIDERTINGTLSTPYKLDRREFFKFFEDSAYDSSAAGIDDKSDTAAFITAADNIDHPNNSPNMWKKELELTLLDYPLKHFYPDAYKLIALTLKVNKLSTKI